jgi:hypothetical protein
MPNIPSMRGVKALETAHFGENEIVRATITPQPGANSVVAKVPNVNIHTALVGSLLAGRTLLWVYAEAGGIKTFIFGYDEHIGAGKIGHAALVNQATIAGEIRKIGGGGFGHGWAISNESGAWGAMGDVSGKSAMLDRIASDMTASLGIIVSAEKAFSRWSFKRKLQELVRGSTRKLQ